MKFTLFLTQRCNLACGYCYIQKQPRTLSIEMAEKAVDFIFRHSPGDTKIDIGFFGGEPLLEYDLLKAITSMIVTRPDYSEHRVVMRIVSNGTIFSDEIAQFLERYAIGLGISFDGLPHLQNTHRPFKNGSESAEQVVQNLRTALQYFPFLPVNSVFTADDVTSLPEIITELSRLGVKNIHLNPDITARWSSQQLQALHTAYDTIGKQYLQYYLDGDPHYINLIDDKVTVLLRNGYRPDEKCTMGKGELAIATSGRIYPCERMVEGDEGGPHCIGHLEDESFQPRFCNGLPGRVTNLSCLSCSLNDYCMHWCGCTNFFSTGEYNRVNHFTCSSEKAAIQAALHVIEQTRQLDISFPDHLQGTPLMSIIGESTCTP